MGLKYLDEEDGAASQSTTSPQWRPQPQPSEIGDATIVPKWLPQALNTAADYAALGPVKRAGLRVLKNMPNPYYAFISDERKRKFLDSIPGSEAFPKPEIFEERSYNANDIARTPAAQAVYSGFIRPVSNLPENIVNTGYEAVRRLHLERMLAQDVGELPSVSLPVNPERLSYMFPKSRKTTRPLPVEGAKYFLKQAGGDRQLAEKLAADAGYSF
jgi:hypothetical protein